MSTDPLDAYIASHGDHPGDRGRDYYDAGELMVTLEELVVDRDCPTCGAVKGTMCALVSGTESASLVHAMRVYDL